MSDLNVLLTRKSPMFFSRLNELSGGRESMCLVSGSFSRIWKFFRITFLIARFCGCMVGEGEWNSVDFFVL